MNLKLNKESLQEMLGDLQGKEEKEMSLLEQIRTITLENDTLKGQIEELKTAKDLRPLMVSLQIARKLQAVEFETV